MSRRCAEALGRRMMVRLVKGAYWDTEVKRAQERGLDGYPVFTRKAATDPHYLACARQMLDARPTCSFRSSPPTMRSRSPPSSRWRDRQTGLRVPAPAWHGRDALQVGHRRRRQIACRIYAPVGGHRDLLAYLVRRLLENGANSSFVSVVGDTQHSRSKSLLVRPGEILVTARAMRAIRTSRCRSPSILTAHNSAASNSATARNWQNLSRRLASKKPTSKPSR